MRQNYEIVRRVPITSLIRRAITVRRAADGRTIISLYNYHGGPIRNLRTFILRPNCRADDDNGEMVVIRAKLFKMCVLICLRACVRCIISLSALSGGMFAVCRPYGCNSVISSFAGIVHEVSC